jgi:hypothetical protein
MRLLPASATGSRAVAGLVAAAAIAVLAGCAAPGSLDPTPPAPSVSAAEGDTASQCQAVLGEVALLSTDVAALAADLGTDPFGALARVPGIIDRATTLGDRVTDPALAAHVEEISTIATAAIEDAQAALSAGDVQGATDIVSAAVADVEPAVTALQEFCETQ